jgi:hypothetical protein
MKLFNFDPIKIAPRFKSDGYAHVANGVGEEFLSFARKQLATYRTTGEHEVRDRKIKGKKRQFLFEFPEASGCVAELTGTVAAIAGLGMLTLSERHIKVYDESAPPFPLLHKDCVASQVAVGIPLEQNVDARLVLLPNAMRGVNPLDVAVFGPRAALGLDGSMHVEPQDADLEPQTGQNLETLMLDVRPGDVVIFPGSSMYHERFNGAGSSVLYLKLNAMGIDFLGEDLATGGQREQGLALLRRWSDEELLRGTIRVSPRLQRISRHYTRLNWTTVLQAHVAGRGEFAISEGDLALLKAVRGHSRVETVLLNAGIAQSEYLTCSRQFRRLAEFGAVDFVG